MENTLITKIGIVVVNNNLNESDSKHIQIIQSIHNNLIKPFLKID